MLPSEETLRFFEAMGITLRDGSSVDELMEKVNADKVQLQRSPHTSYRCMLLRGCLRLLLRA